MIADFWDAMEEAERVRTLGLRGLDELTHALEHEEARLGVKRDAESLSGSDAGRLQAAYEWTEWAKAELANESPHANAQALISMNSALDAMIEQLVESWRRMQVELVTERFMAEARQRAGDAAEKIDLNTLARVEQAIQGVIDGMAPTALKPKGSGAQRYEKPLARIGLAAPSGRPIPDDLDAALAELGALRDVLVHRAGRVDETARKQAATLNYRVGQFVRISRDDYRKYSAAVRCYAAEVVFRSIRNWPEVTDEADGPNLKRWQTYVRVNA